MTIVVQARCVVFCLALRATGLNRCTVQEVAPDPVLSCQDVR